MRDFKRKRAVSTFRGNLPALLLFSILMVMIVVLVVSSFSASLDRPWVVLALSAQAETTEEKEERLERELLEVSEEIARREEAIARLKAGCDILPKEYRIKREEYGTLTEDERIDRLNVLSKELSDLGDELEVKGGVILALIGKQIFLLGDESMSSHDARMEKARALNREKDRLTAELNSLHEKYERLEAEWCFLYFVMKK